MYKVPRKTFLLLLQFLSSPDASIKFWTYFQYPKILSSGPRKCIAILFFSFSHGCRKKAKNLDLLDKSQKSYSVLPQILRLAKLLGFTSYELILNNYTEQRCAKSQVYINGQCQKWHFYEPDN